MPPLVITVVDIGREAAGPAGEGAAGGGPAGGVVGADATAPCPPAGQLAVTVTVTVFSGWSVHQTEGAAPPCQWPGIDILDIWALARDAKAPTAAATTNFIMKKYR